MLVAVVLLALLAIVLAWPVPVVVSRAVWPIREPGLALLAWQAIALGGGLAMIGALIGIALLPFGPDLPAAIAALWPALWSGPIPHAFGLVHVFAFSAALVLVVHLLLNLADTAIRTERERRRHRALVGLLSSPSERDGHTRVLDHPAPVAYCLPGVHTLTVLSNGLVELLDEAELEAVLAHERAHLRQYHHLVLLAFRAWNRALPWFPIANRAERSVALLVELLADDRATRSVARSTLANAIGRVGAAWSAPDPAGGRGAQIDRVTIGIRVERLGAPRKPLRRGMPAIVIAAVVAVVALPAAFLVWLL